MRSETVATETHTVVGIFADARFMHSKALERLEAGDVRDAAEKAWCAARRATDALILAHTGEELPPSSSMTRRMLDELVAGDNAIQILVGRYHTRLQDLHAECFYLGIPPTTHSIRPGTSLTLNNWQVCDGTTANQAAPTTDRSHARGHRAGVLSPTSGPPMGDHRWLR